jgi:hypothetical protein
LQAITINANEWSDAGHAVNHLYDILYMMGRDDIAVGVGGDGGISNAGDIRPNVGGYLPLVDQVPRVPTDTTLYIHPPSKKTFTSEEQKVSNLTKFTLKSTDNRISK